MSAHGTLAVVSGVALVGLEPVEVQVEASLAPGIPVLRLIGLPDAAVREAGDRVRTGLQRCGFAWPMQRLVVNLAPADLPKAGSAFDLPLALAVLVATGQLQPEALAGLFACGEVGLDGSLRPTPGTLPLAAGARALGARRLLVADVAAGEAALVDELEVIAARDLAEVVAVLRGERPARQVTPAPRAVSGSGADLADVRGQHLARRAVEVAAAGGHHLLLSGPPGCGKTMLAHRLHGLLPALELPEALEVAGIHSLAGERDPNAPVSYAPPLREPHHSVSQAALVGGGPGIPRPGELSLAHRGVLVLDELLEAPRHVLDALRQPLERGKVVLTRARARVSYPARVLLVAATNPCPCGDLGHPTRACTCRPDRVERYRARLSGPLLDRIDLQVGLRPVSREDLLGPADGEASRTVAARVAQVRAISARRLGPGMLNRDAPPGLLRAEADELVLRRLADLLSGVGGSARSFDRALRVARTLADLAGRRRVAVEDVEEAVAYRLPPTAATA